MAEDRAPTHWNYRVRGYTAFTGVPGVEPQEAYDIITAYYDGDTVIAWGDYPGPVGESVDDLRAEIQHLLDACDKPVLDDEELPR